jgi:hypothetical protein
VLKFNNIGRPNMDLIEVAILRFKLEGRTDVYAHEIYDFASELRRYLDTHPLVEKILNGIISFEETTERQKKYLRVLLKMNTAQSVPEDTLLECKHGEKYTEHEDSEADNELVDVLDREEMLLERSGITTERNEVPAISVMEKQEYQLAEL